MLYEFFLITGFTFIRTVAQYFFKLAAISHSLVHVGTGIALYACVGYFMWEIIRFSNSLILAVLATNLSNIASIFVQTLIFGTKLTYGQIIGCVFVVVGGYLL